MKKLGLIDVLWLSLDSLKNQPSLVAPIFFSCILGLMVFSFVFGGVSSISELLELVPQLLVENFYQLLILSVIIYLIIICGASVVCGMTKVGIATGNSSVVAGSEEAETHIFSVIVAFLIVGIISGILLIGGIVAVFQIAPEPGMVSALLYAFVILLGFMLGILFLYTLPAIIVDELDSITAIGLSIGIVLNHLRDSMVLAVFALILLSAVYIVSLFLTGVIHFLVFLGLTSFVVTVVVIAVTVDYVNLK
ncbi:MAG: hypothetical protein PVF58_13015 [Candidatus Methanofastidiosia archaeon]|jgi:hypothetical protein